MAQRIQYDIVGLGENKVARIYTIPMGDDMKVEAEVYVTGQLFEVVEILLAGDDCTRTDRSEWVNRLDCYVAELRSQTA
jgi:hypothetical protein